MATKKAQISVQNEEGGMIPGIPEIDYREVRKPMVLGGYTILNFMGHDFISGTEAHDFPGVKKLYDAIESAKKPTMVQNLVIDGQEFKDFFANFVWHETAFTSYTDAAAKAITISVGVNSVTVSYTEKL